MDENRKGQIAIMVLKDILREKGVRLAPDFRREMGNKAKAIGIPMDELMEFFEPIILELVNETFAKSKNQVALEESWDNIVQKIKELRS